MNRSQVQPTYIYMGFVGEQKVARIPLYDVGEIIKRTNQGWVVSTKEAWERYQDGSKRIFLPTEYPTGSGKFIFSHVVYPPSVFKKK